VLDRMTTLAAEASSESMVSTYVAWALCILSLIGIVIAARRWM
jgi:hypothetical protein